MYVAIYVCMHVSMYVAMHMNITIALYVWITSLAVTLFTHCLLKVEVHAHMCTVYYVCIFLCMCTSMQM